MYPSGLTGVRDARSGPDFVNNNVTHTIAFGYLEGVYALKAITGATLWQYVSPGGLEVISSPAIVARLAKSSSPSPMSPASFTC